MVRLLTYIHEQQRKNSTNQIWRYTSWRINILTHTQSPIHPIALSQIQRIEKTLHPILNQRTLTIIYCSQNSLVSLSISLLIAATHLSYLYQSEVAREMIAFHQTSMNSSPLQLGKRVALDIGNRILLEIEFKSCMPLQNKHGLG